MTVVPIDGKVYVAWLPAVANIAAPTTTEMAAGTVAHTLIMPEGLEISANTGKVDTSNLASTYTTHRAGRRAHDVKIMAYHNTNSASDTLFNLWTYQAAGFLLVRRGIVVATAPAASQRWEVYPLECLEPNEDKPVPDGRWAFSTEFCLTADPNTRAVMA